LGEADHEQREQGPAERREDEDDDRDGEDELEHPAIGGDPGNTGGSTS
jgi:hypothetical protein